MTEFEGLDPKEWWPLATIAEAMGITVRELLEARVVPSPPVVPTALERLSAELTFARRSGFRVPRRELSAEDRAWRADQTRRQNLESFRHMDEEWSELA